jgi:hypothetical protein
LVRLSICLWESKCVRTYASLGGKCAKKSPAGRALLLFHSG